jgi:transcriptional activator SPT7
MKSGSPEKSVTPTATTPSPKKDIKKADVKFSDKPAIVRTPEGMVDFLNLDRDMGVDGEGAQMTGVIERLKELVTEEEVDGEDSYGFEPIEGEVGEKRKL